MDRSTVEAGGGGRRSERYGWDGETSVSKSAPVAHGSKWTFQESTTIGSSIEPVKLYERKAAVRW